MGKNLGTSSFAVAIVNDECCWRLCFWFEIVSFDKSFVATLETLSPWTTVVAYMRVCDREREMCATHAFFFSLSYSATFERRALEINTPPLPPQATGLWTAPVKEGERTFRWGNTTSLYLPLSPVWERMNSSYTEKNIHLLLNTNKRMLFPVKSLFFMILATHKTHIKTLRPRCLRVRIRISKNEFINLFYFSDLTIHD